MDWREWRTCSRQQRGAPKTFGSALDFAIRKPNDLFQHSSSPHVGHGGDHRDRRRAARISLCRRHDRGVEGRRHAASCFRHPSAPGSARNRRQLHQSDFIRSRATVRGDSATEIATDAIELHGASGAYHYGSISSPERFQLAHDATSSSSVTITQLEQIELPGSMIDIETAIDEFAAVAIVGLIRFPCD